MFDLEHLKKTYFKMALPVVIGLVITLVYNLVDTYFIARTENTALIAGVSYCGPLFTILMAFGNIFGQGGSTLVSRLLGKGETDKLKNISSFSFFISIITGLVVMATMLIFQDFFLGVLGASGDNLEHARDYYVWLAIGAPAIIVSFIHGNFMRCEGFATASMVGHLIGTVINIILDPILILGLGMGAKGAAIATILGYLISAIFFAIFALKKTKYVSLNPMDMKISWGHFGEIIGIGITVAITNIMQSVSNIFLNRYLKPYGDDAIATMGVVLKVTLISQLILSGFSFGATPVFGYLFGSNNKEKIKELTKFNFLFLGSIGLFLTILLGCGASPIMGIFFKNNQALIDMSATMLRFQAVGTIFTSLIFVFTVLFQASGKIVPAFIMSISRQGVVFIAALAVCNALFQYRGVLATQAVADIVSFIIGAVCCIVFFGLFKGNKKKEA